MKKLRRFFNALIVISLIGLWLLAHMCEVNTITFHTTLIWYGLLVLIIAICALGNWIIYDHFQNQDWLEYLKEMPHEDWHPSKRQR